MHPPVSIGVAARRVLIITLGLIALLATAAQPAAAVEPIDAREPAPRSTPQPQPSREPTPTPTPSPEPAAAPGIDVSWPQCGDRLPESFSFAVVGVNGGRVYSPNPCLGRGDDPSELEWAGAEADLYLNTGNPGPDISSYWPHGQTTPRACNAPWTPGADTIDCAYVYGWNAAADSYRTALDAFVSLGWADPAADRVPGERTWWLDVEIANSWRLDRSLNVATLQGAVDYLESMGVAEVGFYSTPLLWSKITGGTQAFAEHPAWHAGARDLADAQERCQQEEAFTGGELRMVQWVENDLDLNHRCGDSTD